MLVLTGALRSLFVGFGVGHLALHRVRNSLQELLHARSCGLINQPMAMSLPLAIALRLHDVCGAPMHVLRHIRNNFFWLLATATRGDAGPVWQRGELVHSRKEDMK